MGRLVAVVVLCIAVGAAIGAGTSFVNSTISPYYFRAVMRWQEMQNVRAAAVAQGVLEGVIYGTVFAAIFGAVFLLATGGKCRFRRAAGFILALAFVTLCCWGLGGLAAMGLGRLSPEWCRSAFLHVPEESGPMLRYLWVGGSIWGAMIGGFLSAVLGSVVFAMRWDKR